MFVLRDVEELSNSEVADILDLSVAAVKSRLHRARLKVRNRLATYFSEPNSRSAMGAKSAMTCKGGSRIPFPRISKKT